MGRIGTFVNSRKQQRINAELETIIEDFGNAMRNANSQWVTREPVCRHDPQVRMTYHMETAWSRYVEFLKVYPQ